MGCKADGLQRRMEGGQWTVVLKRVEEGGEQILCTVLGMSRKEFFFFWGGGGYKIYKDL